MLLRFLQKGLTFHNIPLMLGITAQDDENVVYSKQIGAEENNGEARRGPVLAPRPGGGAGRPAEGPASGHLVQVGPGVQGLGSELRPPLARWLSESQWPLFVGHS